MLPLTSLFIHPPPGPDDDPLLRFVSPNYLQPFVDHTKTSVQAWFPERKYAIAIPTVIFIIAVAATGTFTGFVFMKSGKKKQ